MLLPGLIFLLKRRKFQTEARENGNNYHALSLSGGKDSSALLLLMLERDMPLDCVLYADTGMEFPEMEAHIAKLDDLLFRERGIHITTLRHPQGFEWLMFDVPQQQERAIKRRIAMGQTLTGYGWPGMKVRWCTGQLKTHLITKEVNRLKKEKNALHYIGIAADETHRCKSDPQNRYPLVECVPVRTGRGTTTPQNRYPLVEWGITETQALEICYDRGYDWGGLYEIYHRCSCWCCPLQRIDELRKLRRHHPELWARLRDMDKRARAQFGPGPLGQFKQNWSVERLEERFAREGAESA